MAASETGIPGEIRTVNQVLRSYRPAYGLVLFHSVFIALLALTPFLYMMQVRSRVYTSRSWETLGFLTLIVVFLIIVWTLLLWLRSNTMRAIGSKIDTELRLNVFKTVHQRQETDAFRYFYDVVTLRNGLTGSFVSSVFDAGLSPIFIGVLFLIHPVYGYVAIGFILIVGVLSLISNKSMQQLKAQTKPLEDKALSFGMGTAAKAQTIQSMNLLPGVSRKWEKYQNAAGEKHFLGQFRLSAIDSALTTLRRSELPLIIGIGAVLYLLDEISDEAAFAAFIIMMRGVGPILSVAQNWSVVQETRGAYERINALLEGAPKRSTTTPGNLKGSLRCENLVLMTSAGQAILRNLSFSIPAGSILGVVGPSGAGKSSLLKLLAGAETNYLGEILVDGFPQRQWPAEVIGDNRGYLPQEVDILPGTIWENVARFRPFSEEENQRVFAALELAGALDLVQSRSKGVEEELGKDGAPLSGGQRQRLGLARALLGMPKIVILDEPNSAQDSSGEVAIANAIMQLKENGSTVVFSSHKAGMMELCDYMLVLVDGYVHSFSTKEDIVERLETGGNTLLENNG